MATRSSSSSSSSSESEAVGSGRVREISETSRETGSRLRGGSPTNTIDGTSIGETTTIRSGSPSASHTSGAVSRTTYDTVSIATTTNTGFTNATNNSQQQSTVVGGIPIIRPPVLGQQQSGTGLNHFGPQIPGGYPTQPPIGATGAVSQQGIQIDVAAAQQQYQQRNVQPEISPSSGSTASSSAGYLSSPGNASIQRPPPPPQPQQQQQQQQQYQQQQQQQYQQQQQQQQQAQFPNQIPAHQIYNELLGPDAFKDVILDIDYGALGSFNVPFQSGGDFSGGQLPPGISVRPAYTTVDSLNYQQHMFNTARTVNAGGESGGYDYGGASSGYDYSGAGSSYDYGGASSAYNVSGAQQYNVGGGQQFDVAKAIFNQADTNRDGGISREEFQNWAQGGQQGYGAQSYSNSASYQTTTANYGGAGNNYYQGNLLAGADPSVANILQQSGLGQVVPN